MGERFRRRTDHAFAGQALRRPRAVRNPLTPPSPPIHPAREQPSRSGDRRRRAAPCKRPIIQPTPPPVPCPRARRLSALAASPTRQVTAPTGRADYQVAIGSRAYISTQSARCRHRNARVPAPCNIAQRPMHHPAVHIAASRRSRRSVRPPLPQRAAGRPTVRTGRTLLLDASSSRAAVEAVATALVLAAPGHPANAQIADPEERSAARRVRVCGESHVSGASATGTCIVGEARLSAAVPGNVVDRGRATSPR
jgi:hypothetical protein